MSENGEVPSVSLYDILKIKRTASKDEITKAWTALYQAAHGKDSEALQKAKNAYEVLSDPVQRQLYNKFRLYDYGYQNAVQRNLNLLITDNSLKSNAAREYEKIMLQEKPNDAHHQVFVTLEDLYMGRKLSLKVKKTVFCKICNGSINIRCSNCLGRRQYDEDKLLSVNIERGMKDGERIRILNEGNEVSSNGVGSDIVLTLKLSAHKIFFRFDNDLFIQKVIGINEALCGFKTTIKHLDGRILKTSFDKVTCPGSMKLIKGEGMPIYNKLNVDERKGDLIVYFEVKFPNALPVDTVKEMKSFLPPAPDIVIPDNPDVEEYNLSEYDPKFKITSYRGGCNAYDDEHPIQKNTGSAQPFDDKCVWQ